jgi:PAS domain S-box-containing protein
VANERAAEIVGYHLDEIEQSFAFWESLMHPEDRVRAIQKVKLHLEGLTDFYEDEYRVRAKSGEWKWILSRGKVVQRTGDGAPLRMTGTLMDVTERKHSERALMESEERYRAVFNNAGFGIGIVGRDWRFEQANPILQDMLGYTEEELQQRTSQDLTHPDDRETSRQFLEALVSERIDSYRIEKRYVRKNGSIIWGDLSASAIRDAQGNCRAMLGMMADITEQQRAEAELKKSEARMRMIIDASPIGIRIVQEGRYVYVNPAFVKLFGYDNSEEILGLPVEALFAPEHRELVRQGVGSSSVGKGRYYEASGIKKNGQPVEVAAWGILIDYEGSPARLGFLVDITESKSLRAQLVQAQKMEAIGTLAGGIAHDFNNLLTVILGYSELLLAEKNEEEPGHEDLQKIHISAGRGADLVQRLLTFSRKTDTKPRPLNLNKEIEQVSNLLARALPKMIQIELALADKLAIVNADPTQVEQVIMNLAVNAKDAMPDGGKIVIGTRNIVLDEAYCAIHLKAKPGPHVLLSVSDTGHGIDKESLEHIFEPFYTTKASGKGTGLGLAVVYGIVHHHGGHIGCYSEPGQGTTFRIYFPVLGMDETEETSAQDKPWPPGGSETILLVDDEKFVRDLGQRILQRAGYKVLVASNGKEALDLYGTEQSTISLVILDLIMPDMGGKECFENLLNIDPQAKVILSSGYASGGTATLAEQLGAGGFVGKPYDTKKFLQTVRDVLDSD